MFDVLMDQVGELKQTKLADCVRNFYHRESFGQLKHYMSLNIFIRRGLFETSNTCNLQMLFLIGVFSSQNY